MNEEEIETLANKVADILWARYEERLKEFAEKQAGFLWDAPLTRTTDNAIK